MTNGKSDLLQGLPVRTCVSGRAVTIRKSVEGIRSHLTTGAEGLQGG